MRQLVFITIMFGIFTLSHAQKKEVKYSLGLGMGVDYGGIGVKGTLMPLKHLGVFGGAGFNFHKLGYNVGTIVKITSGKRFDPYVSAMYGYNGVIKVIGVSEYDNTYYGPSVSLGGEIKVGRGYNFINVELVVPFRTQEFFDDQKAVKNDPRVGTFNEALPVAFSVGFHLGN